MFRSQSAKASPLALTLLKGLLCTRGFGRNQRERVGWVPRLAIEQRAEYGGGWMTREMKNSAEAQSQDWPLEPTEALEVVLGSLQVYHGDRSQVSGTFQRTESTQQKSPLC